MTRLGARQRDIVSRASDGMAWVAHAGQGRMTIHLPHTSYPGGMLDRLLELDVVRLEDEGPGRWMLSATNKGKRALLADGRVEA